jgi:RimJ/RimL family protein N-acetyltransferase
MKYGYIQGEYCQEAWACQESFAVGPNVRVSLCFMPVAETERLTLRWLTPDDAPFMLRLLNEPSFHRFIGDRGIRTVAQAQQYLEEGPVTSYRDNGYGLYLVSSRELEMDEAGQPMGICGLVRRPTLEHADIGFAFVPEFWRKGYALEAAMAVMKHAAELELDPVLAITSLDNERSIALLDKLGFAFDRTLRLAPEDDEVRLFVWSGSSAG